MSFSLLHRTAFALFLILLPVVEASAQKPADFPLTFGGGYATGSTIIEFPGLPQYQAFEFPEGSVSGYTFSVVGIELPVSRVTNRAFIKDLVLMLGARFRSTGAMFVRSEVVLVPLPGQTTPVEQRVESRLAFAVQEIDLDFQMLYPIWAGLGLKGGFAPGYSSLSTWRMTQHLLPPAVTRFTDNGDYPTEDDGRVLVLSSGDDVEADDGFVMGTASLSLQYDLPLGERLSVVPEVGISRMAFGSRPVTGSSWSNLSFAGNLSIRYVFDSDEPDSTPVLPPTGMVVPDSPPASTPSEDLLPRPIPLTASIDLFTLDGDTRRQTMRLVTTRSKRKQEIALPPIVTFEPGQTTLPARYAKIDPAGADEFSLDSIARLDAARAESHLLNIIGSRMHVASRENLRLVISRAGGTAERARAEVVRSYLNDVWQIAPSRMTIETTGTTSESVRLIASPRVLAPVRAEWIEQAVVASPLQIDPRISGGVAPRSWTLMLRRGDELVARRSSDDAGALDLELSFGAPSAGEVPAPLTAELSVRDGGGRVVVARDTMEVLLVGE